MAYQFYNLDYLMERAPVLIWEEPHIKFYEHPTRGDTAGLIAVGFGFAVQTDLMDTPEPEDAEYWRCVLDSRRTYLDDMPDSTDE